MFIIRILSFLMPILECIFYIVGIAAFIKYLKRK